MSKIIVIAILGIFLFGFSGSRRIDTEQGYYYVVAEFPAATARVGKNSLRLVIMDKGSKKPTGDTLDIQVIPWMPSAVHGKVDTPLVKKTGRGEYLVEGLIFDAPGQWEVYIRMVGSGKEDTAVFDVDVVD
ncbi:MAG: hypothetical protein PVJ36_03100 [Nitrospirota bacterium]|jgi:hypothetical protein